MQIEMQNAAGPSVLIIATARIEDRDTLNTWLLHVNAVADALWPGRALALACAANREVSKTPPLRKPYRGSKIEAIVTAALSGMHPREIAAQMGDGMTLKRVGSFMTYARRAGYLPPPERWT